MGTYAVTGSASGMGHATAQRLRADGHRVVGVDLHDADVIADLSTPQGRSKAAAAVLELAGGHLDGAVLAAGVGPLPGRDNVRLILSVNYFGVVDLLQAWQPAFAASGKAKVVVVGSNSSTTDADGAAPRGTGAAARRSRPGDPRAVPISFCRFTVRLWSIEDCRLALGATQRRSQGLGRAGHQAQRDRSRRCQDAAARQTARVTP